MNNLLYVVKQHRDEQSEMINDKINEAIKIFRKNDIDFILVNQINQNNFESVRTLINQNMTNKPLNKIFGIIINEFDYLMSSFRQDTITDRCSWIVSDLSTLEMIINKFY